MDLTKVERERPKQFHQKMLDRLFVLQTKWRTTLVYVNWIVVFVSTIVSLLPIFINCDQQRRGYPSGYFADLLHNTIYTAPVDSETVLSIINDDGIDYAMNLNHAMIMGPFLGLCLPALLDLFAEMYVALRTPTTGMNGNNALTIVRLSMLERFVFIVGVVCSAFYFLIPLDWNVMVIYTVRRATVNLSHILLVTPLVIFFERTTNVFSPFFTSLIVFLLSLGGAIQCFVYDLAYDTMSRQNLNDAGSSIYLVGYLLIIVACFWSFFQFLLRQRSKADIDGIGKQQLDPFQDFSTNHVPACHMVVLCIGFFINIGWAVNNNPPPTTANALWTLLLFATALVFVVEMRARQNEVFSGLAQLDVKHYEVRFFNLIITLIATVTLTPTHPPILPYPVVTRSS